MPIECPLSARGLLVLRCEGEHPIRKLILRMLLTLDGVAAGDNGPIDLVDYSDEGSWRDIFATLETVDAMLSGGHRSRRPDRR